ncbi:MAG: hypothetical protein OCD03_03400 [Hyphomicrobiales bacterium]
MSINRDMVDYFISEFMCCKSVNLDGLVTPEFRFILIGKIPLNFKQYVIMAETISNIVKLNITEINSDDDEIFIMKYDLDVMLFKGGFGKKMSGTIILRLKDSLVNRIEVSTSHRDRALEEYTNFKDE